MSDDRIREHLDELRDELSRRQQELSEARRENKRLAAQVAEREMAANNALELWDKASGELDAAAGLARSKSRAVAASEQKRVDAEHVAQESKRQLAAARRELKALTAERDRFRERLQHQYDLTWTRVGTVLRDARTPRGLARAPKKLALVLRSRGDTGLAPQPTVTAVVRRQVAEELGIDPGDVTVPSPLALLEAGENIPAVAEWPDPARASAFAARMLAMGDVRINDALVACALLRKDDDWIGEALTAAPAVTLTSTVRTALVAALRNRGEIRRPLALLGGSDDGGAEADEHRGALTRNLDLLEGGIVLDSPVMVRSSADGVDSLYLLHNSLPHKSGGYATRTHGLLSGLNRLGRDVVGVTRPGFPPVQRSFDQRPGIAPNDVVDGIRYSRLIGPVTSMPRSDLQGFVETYAHMIEPLVDEVRPRLIHGASNWWNGHAAVAIGAAIGVPSIYEVRGLWEVTRASREPGWGDSDVFELDAMYETEAARLADRVICITGGLRDEMVARGIPAEKITIVPNAVDVDRFASAPNDDSVRRGLGWTDKCVLGFVGSLTFYEGLDLLLEAVEQASNESATELAVLIVGDGPMLQPLKALASELGLDDRCHFAGRVPHSEVERYLSAVDITPFPRLPLPVCEMVSPLKPLESMASRIPVIVSSVQALAEMVPDGCGVVVEKGSVDALASVIATLADDPAQRRQLAENAFVWVSESRNWTAVAQRVDDLYAELLGDRPRK